MRILSRIGVVLVLAVATVLLFTRGQDDWLILALVACAVVALLVSRWARRTEPDELLDEPETGELEEVPEDAGYLGERREQHPDQHPGDLPEELLEEPGEPQLEEPVARVFEDAADAAGTAPGERVRANGPGPRTPPMEPADPAEPKESAEVAGPAESGGSEDPPVGDGKRSGGALAEREP